MLDLIRKFSAASGQKIADWHSSMLPVSSVGAAHGFSLSYLVRSLHASMGVNSADAAPAEPTPTSPDLLALAEGAGRFVGRAISSFVARPSQTVRFDLFTRLVQ